MTVDDTPSRVIGVASVPPDPRSHPQPRGPVPEPYGAAGSPAGGRTTGRHHRAPADDPDVGRSTWFGTERPHRTPASGGGRHVVPDPEGYGMSDPRGPGAPDPRASGPVGHGSPEPAYGRPEPRAHSG